MVLADPGRAAALAAAGAAATGVELDAVRTESGALALRSAFRCDLAALAQAWTRGAVKAMPAEWHLDGPALRLWALAAGRADERGGYLLALDAHAPQTHLPLVAATTRLERPAGPDQPRPGAADQRGAPDEQVGGADRAGPGGAGRRGVATFLGPSRILRAGSARGRRMAWPGARWNTGWVPREE